MRDIELIKTEENGNVLNWKTDLFKEFKDVVFKSKNVMVFDIKNIKDITDIHPKYKTFITRAVLESEPTRLVIVQYISVAYQYITIQAYLDEHNDVKKLYVTFSYIDFLLMQSRDLTDITIERFVGKFPLSEYTWLINGVKEMPPVLEIENLEDVGLSIKDVEFKKGDVIELSHPLNKSCTSIESSIPIEKVVIELNERIFTEYVGSVRIYDNKNNPIPMIKVKGTYNNDLLKELGSKKAVYDYYYDNELNELEGIMDLYKETYGGELSELDIARYRKEQLERMNNDVLAIINEEYVGSYSREEIKMIAKKFKNMKVRNKSNE